MKHTRPQNGDRFPDLSIPIVGGGDIALPRDVEGFYSVILFYSGAWCPYCKAQLAAFTRARASLRSIALHESLDRSLELGILLIGAGIWVVTNPVITLPR